MKPKGNSRPVSRHVSEGSVRKTKSLCLSQTNNVWQDWQECGRSRVGEGPQKMVKDRGLTHSWCQAWQKLWAARQWQSRAAAFYSHTPYMMWTSKGVPQPQITPCRMQALQNWIGCQNSVKHPSAKQISEMHFFTSFQSFNPNNPDRR